MTNTHQPVGTPVWLDLGSNDFAASKDFYNGLFGWEFEDSGPEFGHYAMIRNNGTAVGGAMDTSGMTCPEGGEIPSVWDVYLSVDDLEARLAKARENGATVIVEPGQVGDAGRFAIVVDPSGTPIGMWEPNQLSGYDFTGAPGSPVWFELMTSDFDRAVDFYTKVFDADFVPMPESEGFYVTNGTGDATKFGVCNVLMWGENPGAPTPGRPNNYWRIYLNTESLDPALEKVRELGGQVLDGPEESPFGRLATIADPQGAFFQLIATSEASEE